jgi:hypothetical protein
LRSFVCRNLCDVRSFNICASGCANGSLITGPARVRTTVSNIQTPQTGGQKPGQNQEQDEQKQTQQPVPAGDDDADIGDDDEAIEKKAPGQSQAQKKKLNPEDGGMDAGTLGERPVTEETEAGEKDESEH